MALRAPKGFALVLLTFASQTAASAIPSAEVSAAAATSSALADLIAAASTPTDDVPSFVASPSESYTSQVATSLETRQPDTTGIVLTSLETQGHPSIIPFPTPVIRINTVLQQDISQLANVSLPLFSNFSAPTSAANYTNQTTSYLAAPTNLTGAYSAPSLSPNMTNDDSNTEAAASSSSTPAPSGFIKMVRRAASTNCLESLPTNSIPASLPTWGNHPVPRLGIQSSGPAATNKFYANFFLGNQNQGVWTHPYSMAWSKGAGVLSSWGMAISHIDANQRVYGEQHPEIPGDPVRYFINPIMIQSMILSAAELGSSTTLTTTSLKAFSVQAHLKPSSSSRSQITIPCVQGMGFVTGIYQSLTPSIQTGVFYRSVTGPVQIATGTYRYTALLNDGKTWLIYATSSNRQDPQLTLRSNSLLQGKSGWSGTIQIAKLPVSSQLSTYDKTAGLYPTDVTLSASTSGSVGTYSMKRTTARVTSNTGVQLLMFALPHQIASFDKTTSGGVVKGLTLQTTTKGIGTAVLGTSWTLVEPHLPTNMAFAPYTPATGSVSKLSATAKKLIAEVASYEISEDMHAQTYLNSMYFSGKALSKFAMIVLTLHDLLDEPDLAAQGLEELKGEFAKFVTNQQITPLVYDSKWGGIVSSAGYTQGPNADFGNTYYNDHHFHYGYFIHTAAVIAHLQPSWLALNQLWVDSLVRDAGNPSTTDPKFPFSRMFDWYHGHSWAEGLFESGDGKNEESTSEDVNFAYALKMWGSATNNPSMEARGNLMLAILARSLSNYFLMQDDNVNQPSNFIANKADGILFENKIDHTTYFGTNPEYIEGIHMLPLTPSSAYTRSAAFIAQEWTSYFSTKSFDNANNVVGGWRGILFGNYACVNARAAWNFFSASNFNYGYLDGGASRTWYLAFSAAIGRI